MRWLEFLMLPLADPVGGIIFAFLGICAVALYWYALTRK